MLQDHVAAILVVLYRLVYVETRLGVIAFVAQCAKFAHDFGRGVCRYRYYAFATERHGDSRKTVVAAVHCKVFLRAYLCRVLKLIDVAARFLNADNAVYVGKLRNGFGQNIYARASGDVVNNDGRADGGDCFVMFHNAALRAFIVVGGYDEHGVRAQVLCFFSAFARDGGAVTARADYDRYSAVGFCYNKLDGLFVFRRFDRGGFARGAERNQRRRAARQQVLDVAFEYVVIDISVFSERRDHSRAHARKQCHNLTSELVLIIVCRAVRAYEMP